MIDPRDEVVNKDDLLSDDSSDELKDLYKEFELKYQAIKRKELEKKNKQNDSTKISHETNVTVVPRSPSKIDKPVEAPKKLKKKLIYRCQTRRKRRNFYLSCTMQT